MSVINTNVNAIIARNAGAVNERSMTKAMQQLSTGKRINVAADDAAGLAISTKMTSQIRGLDQAIRNANDGIAMLQVAEGATVEMTNMLQRMRELAVQSRNDTNTSAERSYLDDEFDQLNAEINRIATTTQWNGQNLMDGTGAVGNASTSDNGGRTLAFQVGANATQTITFEMGDFRTAAGPDTDSSSISLETAARVASGSAGALDDIGYLSLVDATNSVSYELDAGTLGTKLQAIVTQIIADGSASTTAVSAKVVAAETQALSTLASAGLSGFTADITVGGTQLTDATMTLVLADSQGRNWTIGFLEADGVTTLGTTTHTEGSPTGTTGVFRGGDLTNQGIDSNDAADLAIVNVDTALAALNAQRSAMGATINRLTYAADNLTNTSANVTAARSRVLDTDYAAATTELARTQIIQQASTAMLAQANQGAQSVLSLLK